MSSLEKAKNLVVELRQYSLEHNRGLLIALVGTKCDAREEDLQFSLSAKNFASKYEVIVFLSSNIDSLILQNS